MPPANGASLGSFLCQAHILTKGYLFGPWAWPKWPFDEENLIETVCSWFEKNISSGIFKMPNL